MVRKLLYFAIDDYYELGVFENLEDLALAIEPPDVPSQRVIDSDGNLYVLGLEKRTGPIGPKWLGLTSTWEAVIPRPAATSEEFSEIRDAIVSRMAECGVEMPEGTPFAELGAKYLSIRGTGFF